MSKKIILSILCCFIVSSFPAQAADNEVFGPFKPLFIGLNVDLGDLYGPYGPAFDYYQPRSQSALIHEENGVTFEFAGKKEEGALRLFVSGDRFSEDQIDLFAEGLNAISPAAGIQFTMDFNL